MRRWIKRTKLKPRSRATHLNPIEDQRICSTYQLVETRLGTVILGDLLIAFLMSPQQLSTIDEPQQLAPQPQLAIPTWWLSTMNWKKIFQCKETLGQWARDRNLNKSFIKYNILTLLCIFTTKIIFWQNIYMPPLVFADCAWQL